MGPVGGGNFRFNELRGDGAEFLTFLELVRACLDLLLNEGVLGRFWAVRTQAVRCPHPYKENGDGSHAGDQHQ